MLYEVLFSIDPNVAVAYVNKYFALTTSGRPEYTGSHFETFAGGGDVKEPDRITSDDLIAVSLLAVHVPAQAALGIVDGLREELSALLKAFPVELHLENLDDARFMSLMDDKNSPGNQIWTLLRSYDNPWHVGPTTASKIMARKRPHLFPIFDRVIKERLGLPHSGGYWRQWHQDFTGDKAAELIKRLEDIREKSSQPHLSLLRTLDIVLWMDSHGDAKSGGETVDSDD